MAPGQLDELAALWTWFAEHSFADGSPLYHRVATAVAADEEVLDLVLQAPPAAHLPLVLLGAVHYLLLDGLEHPLADVYAGRSVADPGPLFLDVCRTQRPALAELLAFRHTQTNECGRSALIGPALTWAAERLGEPLALVDVGASAGLSLLCDRYRLDYGELGTTGPEDSPVTVACQVVAGRPPVADRLPELGPRLGIDREPVDLSDPDDARWLLACVWPDTGRLERTRAAIELARPAPPTVVAGDALDLLGPTVEGLGEDPVVVLTTWAFSYFGANDRRAFTEQLAELSTRRPLVWVSGDLAGVVEELGPPATRPDGGPVDVLGAVVYEHGRAEGHLLGLVHPHGAWLDWRAA